MGARGDRVAEHEPRPHAVLARHDMHVRAADRRSRDADDGPAPGRGFGISSTSMSFGARGCDARSAAEGLLREGCRMFRR